MKVVILAGGMGTRLQEETVLRPKPMVEIGGYPMLWHIMKIYASQGYNEFIIALGYKGDVIKDYFLHYQAHHHSLTIKLKSGEMTVHDGDCEDWTVHLVDTGLTSQTGERIKRLKPWIEKDENFMLTYGDGVGDINLSNLMAFHHEQNRLATITAVRPPARFGGLGLQGNLVNQFIEKPQSGERWISGGFFVLRSEVIDYIGDDNSIWEREPIERLTQENQLAAYRHEGFWQCMDTVRDVQMLEKLWQTGEAPWKVW